MAAPRRVGLTRMTMDPDQEILSFPKDGAEDKPHWSAALATLINARLELARLESRHALGSTIRVVILVAVAAIATLFTWALLVAGGVACIVAKTAWPWHWVALAAGGLHLLVALICLVAAKTSKPAIFPITLEELKKDREWLQNLKTESKPNA